jgi:hypothetical protein
MFMMEKPHKIYWKQNKLLNFFLVLFFFCKKILNSNKGLTFDLFFVQLNKKRLKMKTINGHFTTLTRHVNSRKTFWFMSK